MAQHIGGRRVAGGAEEGEALAASEPTTIRVIETKRHLTDPMIAGQEELALVLAALQEVPELAEGTLRAYLDIARFLQGPLAPLLAWPSRPGSPAVLGAVLVRELLANAAVRPIISARGRDAEAEEPGQLRVRPAGRVRAVDLDGTDAALASEEPAIVEGFAIDPLAAGAPILSELGRGACLGAGACAASGAYSAAAASAGGPVHPPEYLEEPGTSGPLRSLAAKLRRRGLWVVGARASPGSWASVPEALLWQSRAAVNFYLSGAATAAVLARLAAAARGEPGAPSELLAAVGPPSRLLAAAAEPEAPGSQGPTWRDADTTERLRYLLERLSRTEAIAAKDPGTWAYDLTPLDDLFRVGAFGVYLYLLTEGRGSPRLDQFLELAFLRRARQNQLRLITQQTARAAARARLYMIIVEDKFGTPRAQAVLEQLRVTAGSRARGAPGGSLARATETVQVDDPEAVLKALARRERELVETEYENRRREWEASVSNRCPHVRLARRLRAARDSGEALTTLRDLSHYFAPDAGRERVASAAASAVVDAAGRDGKRISPAAEMQWLMCRNCNFRALCPHVQDRIRLEARRASYDAVRTRLLRYAVRIQVTSDGAEADAYTYYCRICSERLAENIEEDRTSEDLGRFGDLDAGLRTKIWTVALAASSFVRFPVPTDGRQFASATSAVVYPLLMAAEEEIIRKGRRRKAPRPQRLSEDPDAEEEFDPRTQLYAVLFVYAYILALIQTSQTGRAGTEISFAGVKAGSKISVYGERILRHVAEAHRGLLSQIEDVSAEFLAARFREAFRLVQGEGGASLQAASPEEELAVQTTTIDPVYRYAAVVARVAGDLPSGRPDGPAEARREFELVLGASLPDIIKRARENVKDPALAPLYLRRTGVEVPPGGTLETLMKEPRVNLYANLYVPSPDVAGAEAKSAMGALDAAYREAAARRTGGRKAKGAEARGAETRGAKAKAKDARKAEKPHPRGARPWRTGPKTRPLDPLALEARGLFFESYAVFAMYTRGDRGAEYERRLRRVRNVEAELEAARVLAAVKTFFDFGFARTQQFVPVDVPVTALYDENGVAHDWNERAVYYYWASEGPQGEAATSTKEVVVHGGPAGAKKASESGKLVGMTLVDVGCPVCGARQSQISGLDVKKTWKALQTTSEIDSFFVFYESRCPKGDLHTWTGPPSACSKCGLTATLLADVMGGRAAKNRGARDYYSQYASEFARVRRALWSTRFAPAQRVPPAESATTLEWSPDYTLIVKAAELANVPPTVIEAIGSMEGRSYADVAGGRDIPSPPALPSDPRIYAADAEARAFLSDYGFLRHAARLRHQPPFVSKLLAAAGVPKHELSSLPVLLPDVRGEYYLRLEHLRKQRPADALAFAIESLCRMVLSVAGQKDARVSAVPEWARRLSLLFATHELQKILRGQRLLSKPGSFNRAIFFEAGDDIVPEQAGDVGEDVLDEILAEDREEAPDDPFSGENMDYDTTEDNPNNEPD